MIADQQRVAVLIRVFCRFFLFSFRWSVLQTRQTAILLGIIRIAVWRSPLPFLRRQVFCSYSCSDSFLYLGLNDFRKLLRLGKLTAALLEVQRDGVSLRGACHVEQVELFSLNTKHVREILLGDSVRIFNLPFKVCFLRLSTFCEVLASHELALVVVVDLDVEVGRVDIDEARDGRAVFVISLLTESDVHLVPDSGQIELLFFATRVCQFVKRPIWLLTIHELPDLFNHVEKHESPNHERADGTKEGLISVITLVVDSDRYSKPIVRCQLLASLFYDFFNALPNLH